MIAFDQLILKNPKAMLCQGFPKEVSCPRYLVKLGRSYGMWSAIHVGFFFWLKKPDLSILF